MRWNSEKVCKETEWKKIWVIILEMDFERGKIKKKKKSLSLEETADLRNKQMYLHHQETVLERILPC